MVLLVSRHGPIYSNYCKGSPPGAPGSGIPSGEAKDICFYFVSRLRAQEIVSKNRTRVGRTEEGLRADGRIWVFMQSLYPSQEDPLSTSERKARQISSAFVKQY